MNRRQVLLKLLTTVPSVSVGGVSLAEAVTNHVSRHWLDSVSSEDIEASLRAISDETWARFRRELSKLRRRSQAARKRERRADNTVIWRGIVTDDMPPEVLARLNTVPSARRDVGITSANTAFVWQGQTIFPGSRILIDSRVKNIIGARGEIIDTPHKGRRVHIWPGLNLQTD